VRVGDTANRLGRVTALLALGLCAGAPAASAVTLEQHSEHDVTYVGDPGELNRLTVKLGSARGGLARLSLDDPGARRIGRGGSYRVIPRLRVVRTVRLPLRLFVDLGDRDDSVHFVGELATPLGPRPAARVTDPTSFLPDPNPAQEEPVAELRGGSGDDTVAGTRGFDVIDGGPGRDQVDGGLGDDLIVDRPDHADDRLRGGSGMDGVQSEGRHSVTIDLRRRTLTARGETDTLDSLEAARGGRGADRLLGSERADGLFGYAGADTVRGRGGDDLVSGDGPMQLFGGRAAGHDVLDGGPGADLLDARDTYYRQYPPPVDELRCGPGPDSVVSTVEDQADATCESAAFGSPYAPPYADALDPRRLARVQPLARREDGAPTYSLACPPPTAYTAGACTGRVKLESPPFEGMTDFPEVLGSVDFTIPEGQRAEVTVPLTPSGTAALAQPGTMVAVHVLFGAAVYLDDRTFPPPEAEARATANFGWQQRLGR
jgi:hypothetical protein